MHPEARAQFQKLIAKYVPSPWQVLEVGSMDVNGNVNDLLEAHGWSHVGVDIAPGKNVDVLMDPDWIPFDNDSFELVFSISTLEHVRKPWILVPEMARVLRPGGQLIILTHHWWDYHPWPVDCWRFLPDGLLVLFDLCGNLTQCHAETYNEHDVFGIATKV